MGAPAEESVALGIHMLHLLCFSDTCIGASSGVISTNIDCQFVKSRESASGN